MIMHRKKSPQFLRVAPKKEAVQCDLLRQLPAGSNKKKRGSKVKDEMGAMAAFLR